MVCCNGCKNGVVVDEEEEEEEVETFVVKYVLNELVITHTHTQTHFGCVNRLDFSLFIAALVSMFVHSEGF